MARENCDRCNTPCRALDVVSAEVGLFDDLDGGPKKLKIDLIVACPDCGLSFYTFVNLDDLITEEM
ncbi:MAG TPA: hypothetical protein GXX56_01905 [Rhodocyclaceae bacterium]|nr:hypothetical protein [Rhodocyclaceae bacterium]